MNHQIVLFIVQIGFDLSQKYTEIGQLRYIRDKIASIIAAFRSIKTQGIQPF